MLDFSSGYAIIIKQVLNSPNFYVCRVHTMLRQCLLDCYDNCHINFQSPRLLLAPSRWFSATLRQYREMWSTDQDGGLMGSHWWKYSSTSISGHLMKYDLMILLKLLSYVVWIPVHPVDVHSALVRKNNFNTITWDKVFSIQFIILKMTKTWESNIKLSIFM